MMDLVRQLLTGRSFHILLLVVVGVAIIGFMVGTGRYHTDYGLWDHPRGETKRADNLETAPSYRARMAQPVERNSQWRDSLDEASRKGPGLFEPFDKKPGDHDEALAERAKRRAYPGAPPVVPHPVNQLGPNACAECHTQGAVVAGETAPPMSHEFLTNCTQCHVVQSNPFPVEEEKPEAIPLDNAFAAKDTPGLGPRWTDLAPPQIPHSTRMRSNCNSCHGVKGKIGLRTTHPWRQSCTQCHTPSAVLDQRPLVDDLAPIAR